MLQHQLGLTILEYTHLFNKGSVQTDANQFLSSVQAAPEHIITLPPSISALFVYNIRYPLDGFPGDSYFTIAQRDPQFY